MRKFLVQSGDIMIRERRCALSYEGHVSFSDFNSLDQHLGDFIPVGSVEFTREFARLNGIALPEWQTYPPSLQIFAGRRLWKGTFSDAEMDDFVKPLRTKAFTGDIKSQINEAVDPREPVWISDPVEFKAEFRYYVLDRAIVGFSRYDDKDEEISPPEKDRVQIMIDSYEGQPIGYSIDVGIIDKGAVLVEVNDGWSLGYYPWGNMTPRSYVDLIEARWKQIQKLTQEIK